MSKTKSLSQTYNKINRRTLLKLGSVALAIGMFTPRAVFAKTKITSLPANNFELFMLVSKALTGKRNINQIFGKRLYQTLSSQNEFSDSLLQFQPLPKGNPDQWSSQQKKIAKTILSAWYLGVVTSGKQTKLIAYENALMFDSVSDVLVIRSYCSNRPGYWANKPLVAA